MKVTCEIKDRSKPAKQNTRIHSEYFGGDDFEVEINGERYTVNDLALSAQSTNVSQQLWEIIVWQN